MFFFFISKDASTFKFDRFKEAVASEVSRRYHLFLSNVMYSNRFRQKKTKRSVMDFLANDVDDDENIVFDNSSDDRNVLRIVVTEASTEIAHALMYRIFSNNVFEDDQLIYLVVYETFEKALFLESIVIELTEFSPIQLYGSQFFEKIA